MYFVIPRSLMSSSLCGSGCGSSTVTAITFLRSTHILLFPSFFGTITIRAAQGSLKAQLFLVATEFYFLP